MDTLRFSKTFPSEFYTVKSVIQEIMGFLSSHIPTLCSEDYYDLKLIFSELLLNAVIHGNKKDITKFVSFYVEITKPDLVYACIKDEGMGFDYKELLSPCKSEDRLYLERGRGIQLVYSLADEISFTSSGSQINFCKRVNT
jgi:serine/threonine-protein kinase RsbW